MTWTCEQTEARLSDYLEGALNAEERLAFDAHVNACARCTPLVASVGHLLSSMHAMEPVEAPPRLVYGILDKTLGPREAVGGWRLVLGWLQGMASMRFAYGALSVVATLMIFVTASGFNWRRPKLADLAPSVIYRNTDKQAHLVYARGMKFVNDMRVVNEIQSRLRQDSEIPAVQENVVPQSAPEKQPGQTDGTKPASPRQQNRANDVTRQLEELAEEMPLLGGPWMGGQTGARKMP
jgi:anti-sigma-K factor RskA